MNNATDIDAASLIVRGDPFGTAVAVARGRCSLGNSGVLWMEDEPRPINWTILWPHIARHQIARRNGTQTSLL